MLGDDRQGPVAQIQDLDVEPPSVLIRIVRSGETSSTPGAPKLGRRGMAAAAAMPSSAEVN